MLELGCAEGRVSAMRRRARACCARGSRYAGRVALLLAICAAAPDAVASSERFDTVVVWCVRFSVAFTAADLIPA